MSYTSEDWESARQEILSGPIGLLRRLGYRGTPDGRRQFGWVHEEMSDHYASAGDGDGWHAEIITRDHAKTTMGCGTLVWRKLWDPGHRLVLASAGMDLAEKLVGNTRSMCAEKIWVGDERVWLSDMFPWIEVAGDKSKIGKATDEFNCVGREGKGPEPCFFAKSPGTSFAGYHPTGGHLDDLTTEKGAKSASIRLDGIDFLQRLRPIMKRGFNSPLTAAATPWHYFDTSKFYQVSPNWKTIVHGVLDGRNGDETLCPSFLNMEEWIQIRDDPTIEEHYKASQYLCKPIAGSNSLFTEKMIENATREDWPIQKVLGFRQFGSYALWDPTNRTDARNMRGDANGCVILKAIPNHIVKVDGIEPDRNIWFVVRAHQEKGGADAMLEWIQNEAVVAHPDIAKIGIEESFQQSFVLPWAQRSARKKLPFEPVNCGRAQQAYRLMGLATAFRSGMVIFPPSYPGSDLLRRQLVEYPNSDYDDVPCALALLSSLWFRRGPVEPATFVPIDRSLTTRRRRRHNQPTSAWSQ